MGTDGRTALVALAVVALHGCWGVPDEPGSRPRDAASDIRFDRGPEARDVVPRDESAPDAGHPDVGVADAGPRDAPADVPMDAGSRDAPSDVAVDTGTRDAAIDVVVDAGARDAQNDATPDIPPADVAPVDVTSERDAGSCGAAFGACCEPDAGARCTPESRAVCSGGVCVPCPATLFPCGTACVDLQTSAAHCGACRVACMDGYECRGSACRLTCATGLIECGGRCVSTLTDPEHCGMCGNRCPSTGNTSPSCRAGVCGAGACLGGWSDCNAQPGDGCEASVATDRGNCGRCGVRCAPGRNCVAGACQ